MKAIGGFRSIWYVLKKARQSGGLRAMWRAMRAPNACKTCALGMGGQRGGMENERGKFPEFCKKSVQAMAADMQGAITPAFFEQYTISQLAAMSPRELESCGRLVSPMIAGPLDLHYTPISWDDAISKIATSIRDTDPHRSFYYCSGRSSNEAGFLLQLAARVRGTNNINNCSYYCHQASGVGLSSVTGSGTATVVLDDLEQCDLIFLIGCNPSSNHPRLLKNLIDLRRRGGKVIVINPIREKGLCNFRVPSDFRSLLFGSKISDMYIQPNIAGDATLLLGMIKWLNEHGGIESSFVDNYADGFEDVLAQAESVNWTWIEQHSGVDKQTISLAASMYKESKSAIFCWAMGITHAEGGVDTVRMIANTAIARGMMGRRGAGLLPLRGHSNVQGIGSVGVVPVLKEHMREAIQAELGITLPAVSSSFMGDTMSCMEASHAGDIDLAVCLGGNLLSSNPDTEYAVAAMSKIKLVAYMSTTLNQGHVLGRGSETIVLPVIARDEESQITTQESMFNYVRRSSGGAIRHSGTRSEVDIIVDLATGGVGEIEWEKYRDYDTIRSLMSSCVKGFSEDKEHQLAGRTFHRPVFNTPSGRAQSHAVPITVPRSITANSLRLMTIRSEGQFNTVVYEEEDIFRNQTRRDIVMMHESDIQRLGIQENDRVTVRGTSGKLNVIVRCVDIAKGNCAMYFPEANILLSHDVDAESRTPLFNGELVQIIRSVDAPK